LSSQYKRLIEVDLPIKVISQHARKEQSTRQGHISMLHRWWARRPLGVCRSIILGALLPDPVDANCPSGFKEQAWEALRPISGTALEDDVALRKAILDFIGDFSSWKNSNNTEMVRIAKALVKAAYPQASPLVLDPFAGGGAIPLETLRVGAQIFATDYNPVAFLLLKMILEYVPKYDRTLSDELTTWGKWVKEEAHKDVGRFYLNDEDGSIPVAYMWARTIICEGPSCGARIPLIKHLVVERIGSKCKALQVIPDRKTKTLEFKLETIDENDVQKSSVRRGSVTCWLCDHTTKAKDVREQLSRQNGGSNDSILLYVLTKRIDKPGLQYRLATKRDEEIAAQAMIELNHRIEKTRDGLSIVPNEKINPIRPSSNTRGVSPVTRFGMNRFRDLFTYRQLLTLSTFANIISKTPELITLHTDDPQLGSIVSTFLGLALDRLVHQSCSLAIWNARRSTIDGIFSLQAIRMTWNFPEANPFSNASGNWDGNIDSIKSVIEYVSHAISKPGRVELASAINIPLPNMVSDAIVTDPPYYDSIIYSDLSDFFYVWLKRSIGKLYPDLFKSELTSKDEEIVVTKSHKINGRPKDELFFERKMRDALCDAKRVLKSNGGFLCLR
jgi:putative DNA methylase